jgi:membrane-bound lytic murein transglycosylase D
VRFVPLVRMTVPSGVGSLDQAAVRLGTDAARLRSLNPAYRQGRIVTGAPRDVLAPATALAMMTAGGDSAETTNEEAPGPARTHTVKPGDTLSRIASRYGVPLARLFSINGLGAKSILHPGQVIRLDP